ncbi:MAG: DNA polymerase III subunit delta [Bacteroidetes bacterium]|nr:DNA polymerase III subunit delta [Bacteroidota bacterium]
MAKVSKEKADSEEILSEIKKGKLAPVYLFYGEETFFIDECIEAIIDQAVDPALREFNFDNLRGGEVDGEKVLSIVTSFPMMAERRLVVVKEFEKLNDNEILESYIEKPLDSTILVLVDSKPDFRKKLYAALRKSALCAEFAPFWENKIIPWIESRVKKMQYFIEPRAVTLLQSYVGTSLREIANELEKIFLYLGERKIITVKDVEEVVGISREFTAFELANMVGEKNINRAMEICERLLQSGESPVPILAAWTNQWMKMWKMHDALRQQKPEEKIATLIGVPNFYVKQYIGYCRKHSVREIENAFCVLAEADLAVKSSADSRTVLMSAITKIINGIPA